MVKTPPDGVGVRELQRVLEREYRVRSSELQFLPWGEDSWIFSADLIGGGRRIVRLQGRRRTPDYSALLRLRDAGLDFVLTPVCTHTGQPVVTLGPYSAALFPFIPGGTLMDHPSAERTEHAGRLLASLHAAAPPPGLPVESFDPGYGPCLSRLCEAGLLPDAGRVLEYHDRAVELGLTLRGCELVLTHGDPNAANWLIGADGELWLCDWGELGLGPRERDLFAFADFEWHAALHGYGNHRVREDMLRFYRMRWVLQEICDYGTRLIGPRPVDEEAAHAAAELRRYLDEVTTA